MHIILITELEKEISTIRISQLENGTGVRQVFVLGPVPGHAHKEPHQEEEERLVHIEGKPGTLSLSLRQLCQRSFSSFNFSGDPLASLLSGHNFDSLLGPARPVLPRS